MTWRRRVRYYKERLPGYGIVVNSVDRGEDAPLTRRDERSLVLMLFALLAIPALVVAVGFAVASFLL